MPRMCLLQVGTHARVLGSDWAVGRSCSTGLLCRLCSMCVSLRRAPGRGVLELLGLRKEAQLKGRFACEASGPRIEQPTQTLGRGPRLVPGLSSANGRFVFMVVDPSRVKKTARAPCPFFPACLAGCHR